MEIRSIIYNNVPLSCVWCFRNCCLDINDDGLVFNEFVATRNIYIDCCYAVYLSFF